ncbi:MAG: DUF3558 domain-containing protein [Actinophytocola sp.]|uniref:DUF3558 domain-containing protein n=1 Tax=Actinophytocola sp. TaxID=1872138 RepID=UPI003C72217C
MAGCTTSSAGTPTSAPGETTVTSGGSTQPPPSSGGNTVELPYAGAPEVEDPLDTGRFEQDPCLALTSDQAAELEVGWPGESREAPLGKACTWRSENDSRALVEVASQSNYPHGLSAVYKREEDGKWAFFTVLKPVDGYPVVGYGQVDQRDTGGCRVEVGMSDEIAFDVVLQLSAGNVGKKEPCETAAVVAGMVVETMKAAQ